MKSKGLAVGKALLWCLVMLLFPTLSGTLSVVLSLTAVETLFLQGAFMLLALIPPAAFVLRGRWRWEDIGFAPFHFEGCKQALYFLPILVIFVPAALEGFHAASTGYVLGNLFLYLSVGLSEELFFRGIIPSYLKKVFPARAAVPLSALMFGLGHIAAALAGLNALEIALTVLNALIFGWLAMEMTLISSNIIPAALVHFLFDFETKIAVMDGETLLAAEGFRGALMAAAAVWLTIVRYRQEGSLCA